MRNCIASTVNDARRRKGGVGCNNPKGKRAPPRTKYIRNVMTLHIYASTRPICVGLRLVFLIANRQQYRASFVWNLMLTSLLSFFRFGTAVVDLPARHYVRQPRRSFKFSLRDWANACPLLRPMFLLGLLLLYGRKSKCRRRWRLDSRGSWQYDRGRRRRSKWSGYCRLVPGHISSFAPRVFLSVIAGLRTSGLFLFSKLE
jgi:hypothetical protein